MKKTISNIHIALTLFLTISLLSCSSSKKKESDESSVDSTLIIEQVVAIGKVLPADGWVQISSPSNGIIEDIKVNEGDEVQAGQVLITLKTNTATLDVAQAKAQLESLEANKQVNQQDLAKEEILLKELQSKYQTSKELYTKGAETRENMETDFSNYKQQVEKINSLKKQIQSNRFAEKEQQIAIAKTQETLKDYAIFASKSGILTELTAEIGQSVNNSDVLGQLVENNRTIIEAEVDELFADQVRVGQLVQINQVGKTEVLSNGKISYVGTTLVNKSIFFETANEAEDRRVRRIKIQPDSTSSLLINSKVECRITLK